MQLVVANFIHVLFFVLFNDTTSAQDKASQ